MRTALITDFFLLFDFDPQASEYSPDSLRSFQTVAIDSTDCIGKLLLSHPMIEAYKDACALDADRFLALEACQPIGSYKSTVHARLTDEKQFTYLNPTSYRREDYARGIARSAIKASRLASRENLGTRYDFELYGNLAERCDEVDLTRLLESQQRRYEESQTVSVVCTALFFLSIWPLELNRAWAHCKSLGRT